jgi:predicted peptidase
MTIITKEPGLHEQILPDKDQRFTIYIPDGVIFDRALPLILVLHWGGEVTPYYGKSILVGLIAPALHELGAIIVAPDCRHDDWANRRSETDLLELLDFICQSYLIDRDRILLTGYSMGGVGTWHIAARHQDRFTVAIPMASIPPQFTLDVNLNIPIYAINSRMDELFSYDESFNMVKKLQAKGAAIEFNSLDAVTHFDATGYLAPLKEALPWIRSNWG